MIATGNAEKAALLVLAMLPDGEAPTEDSIRTNVGLVLSMLQQAGQGEGIDEAQLVRHIESLCNIFVPTAVALEDHRDHHEWLPGRRAEIEWRFWDRYKRYLQETMRLGPQAIRGLNDVTDQILRRLEDPHRPGAWDRRGMVVGQVQSGKTSNYTALICKAADAGYRLIVVLAGIHNSLRSQTQLRLDESFLGFDTQQRRLFDQSNVRIGVGRLAGAPLYHAHSLTNSEERGDFNLRVARQSHIMIGGAEPVLLVVKKNASVLKNLLQWATQIQQSVDPSTGKSIVRDVPLLLIDDEADNASVNTNATLDENGQPDPDLDPTKINGLIRKLLRSFEKSAYVGYTATPFANIYIPPDVENDTFGKDLFPSSFIINLAPPSNYVGPARVFGMAEDRAAGIEETPGLPIIRSVDDYRDWMPDGHTKDHVPGPLPASLHRALRSFVITCAAREARGQDRVHNSMLVHVTRYTAVQSRVTRQVEDELMFLQQRLKYGQGNVPRPLLDELRELWETDYAPTMGSLMDTDLTPLSWDAVEGRLYATAARIEVRKINGTVKDTRQYVEYPDGLSVICIGGDKLSRGLTLEGLSVSYYLRASRMYDTLMQMGRWFGYRPGYMDLCRLYTTTELIEWYRDITLADDELRRRFEDMAALEATPMDYGLGVRNHPDGLTITAAPKMRHGRKLLLSFALSIVETITFFEDEAIIRDNLETTERLIATIDARYPRRTGASTRDNHVWDHVDAGDIIDWLSSYVTHDGARKARADVLRKYIEARLTDDELVEWTVALISNRNAGEGMPTIAGLDVGLTGRQRFPQDAPTGDRYVIKRLVSPPDEAIDLTEDEYARALTRTRDNWQANPRRSRRTTPPDAPGGEAIRAIRPRSRGLLLLYPLDPVFPSPPVGDIPIVGFAMSFPESADTSAIEYVVNNVYWEQEFGSEL